MHPQPQPASAQPGKGRHRGSRTAALQLKSSLGPPDLDMLTVWVVFLPPISATGSHAQLSCTYSLGALYQTRPISRSCRSTEPHPASTRWKIFRHSAALPDVGILGETCMCGLVKPCSSLSLKRLPITGRTIQSIQL